MAAWGRAPLLLAAFALFFSGIAVGFFFVQPPLGRVSTSLRSHGNNSDASSASSSDASSASSTLSPAPAPAARAAGAQLFANHGKDVLSSWARPATAHVCSGFAPIEVFHGFDHAAPQRFMLPELRSCVFRNLCWSGSEFVYFRDPAHPLPFEHSNVAGALFAAPAPLLAYGQQFARDDARDWLRLTVVNETIPASYNMTAGAGADGEPTVHLLVGASWMGNIGHELADSVWPAFGTLLETRMLALDNQVVIVGTPYGSFGSHTGLSYRPPMTLGDFPAQTCFPWVVAGNSGRGLPSPPLPSLFSWAAMQSFFFQRFGLPHGALDASAPAAAADAAAGDDGLRIVIRYKGNRHSFTNYDELIAGLRRCYPHADVALVTPDALSFEEELRLLANATVYITPGGGGSFTAPFLSRNAVLILGAACWPNAAANCAEPTPAGVCCIQVERHVWSNWQYFHTEYLTYLGPASNMTREDVQGLFEPLLWNYPADLSTLIGLIDRGLYLRKSTAPSSCASGRRMV